MISVDTKKKDLVGDFKNPGREWQPKGEPELVRSHDCKDKELGKAIPYGIHDLADDTGWVNVGIDDDTAQFAVASIRSWWQHLGSARYPNATTLTITADCGGSNGNSTRLWKAELQRLADETGLAINVCHFPPGTSTWRRVAGGGVSAPGALRSRREPLGSPGSHRPAGRAHAEPPVSEQVRLSSGDDGEEPARGGGAAAQSLVFPHGPPYEDVVEVAEGRIQRRRVETSV